MKIIKICLLIILISFSFTGCEYISEIENKNIVTAVSASMADGNPIYKFYVSRPSDEDGGDEGGSKADAVIYTFSCNNFNLAVKNLEHSGLKTDFSHLSLFVSDEKYLNDKLSHDDEYIRKSLKISPVAYFCLAEESDDKIFECISSEYKSNAEDFVSYIFGDKEKYLSCPFTSVILSNRNAFYSANVPVVSVNDHGGGIVPEKSGAVIYSVNLQTKKISNDDYKKYCSALKKAYKNAGILNITHDNEKISVDIKDKGAKEIAKKYANENVDVLNIIYFSKRSFETFSDYEKFIKDVSVSEIVFK